MGLRPLLRKMVLQLVRLTGAILAWSIERRRGLVVVGSLASLAVGCWWIYPPLALIVLPALVLADLAHVMRSRRSEEGED